VVASAPERRKGLRVDLEKPERKPDDEMRAFTMFLLGREDVTQQEKQEILRSRAEKQLVELLKQKNALYSRAKRGEAGSTGEDLARFKQKMNKTAA